jgi:hypothetical protein
MRTLFFFIVLLLIGCHSQLATTPHKEKKIEFITVYTMQRNGTGKKIHHEKTELAYPGNITSKINYNEKGEEEYRTEYTYDASGNNIGEISYSGETFVSLTKINYNSQKKIMAYSFYYPDTNRNFTIHLKYNEKGQNFMDLAESSDGSFRFRDRYYFDSNEKCIKWDRYEPDSIINHTVHYRYDKNGNEIQAISSMGTRSEFIYDSNGKISKEYLYNTIDTTVNGDTGYMIYLKEYTYDAAGNILGIQEFNDEKFYPDHPSKIYFYEYSYFK